MILAEAAYIEEPMTETPPSFVKTFKKSAENYKLGTESVLVYSIYQRSAIEQPELDITIKRGYNF